MTSSCRARLLVEQTGEGLVVGDAVEPGAGQQCDERAQRLRLFEPGMAGPGRGADRSAVGDGDEGPRVAVGDDAERDLPHPQGVRKPVSGPGGPGAGSGGSAAGGRGLGRQDRPEQQRGVLDGAVRVLSSECEGDLHGLVVLRDGHVEGGGVGSGREVVPPVEQAAQDVADEGVAGAGVGVVQGVGRAQRVHLGLAERREAVGPGVVDDGRGEERAVDVEDLQPVGAAGAAAPLGPVEGAHRSAPAGTRCTTAAGKVKNSTRE